MKIGDKKLHNVVIFTGNRKKDILAVFNKLEEEAQEQRLLALIRRKREVNEAAKKIL